MSVISTIKRMIGGEESPGTDEEEEDANGGVTVEFQKKNVAATADHDLAFFASATYVDDDGDTHSVERTFDVYTDEGHRRDGKPVAKVTEEHAVVHGDEADVVDEQKRDLVIDVESGLDGLREASRIQEFCEEWHRSNARPTAPT